jgi:hypothetical protein
LYTRLRKQSTPPAFLLLVNLPTIPTSLLEDLSTKTWTYSFLLGLGAQQVGHDHCSHCAVKPGVGLEELLLLSGGLVFSIIKRHAQFLELGVSGPLSWLGTGSQLGGQ